MGRLVGLVFALVLPASDPLAADPTNLGSLNFLVIGVFAEGENRVLSDGQILIETEDFEAVTAATIADLHEYVHRVSYRRATVSGQFTGPYDIGTGICAISSLGQRLAEVYQRALDRARLDVDLTQFNRVAFVHPSIGGCLNTSATVAVYEYNGSTLTFHGLHGTSFDRVTWIHELGHSFGNVVGEPISHVELLDCEDGQGGFTIISDSCVGRYNAFNSMYDPMGVLTPSHFSSINKEKIGWFPASDSRVAVSGTFGLRALEAESGGILALKVPLPGYPYQLRVEYRVPEAAPPYADPTLYPIPGVIIHAEGIIGRHYNIRADESYYLENGLLHLTGPIAESTVYAFGDSGVSLELLQTNGQTATVRLTSDFPGQTQCNDGVDNDGDGSTDVDDENCSSGGTYDPSMLSEFSLETKAAEVPALSTRGTLLSTFLMVTLGSWKLIGRRRTALER